MVEVKPNKVLGQIYVTPAENKSVYGAGVSVPAGTGHDTQGNVTTTKEASSPTTNKYSGRGGGGQVDYTKGGGSGSVQEALAKTGGGTIEPPKALQNIRTQQDLRNQTRETYNPRIGTYERTRDPYTQYGTREVINVRLPTREERRRIDLMESSPLTANLEKLQTDIRETKTISGQVDKGIKEINEQVKTLDAVDKSIESLIKGKVNENGEFIGTQSEYKNYLRNVEAREKEYSKYEKLAKDLDIKQQKLAIKDRTLDFSFFGNSNKVRISELSEKVPELSIASKYGSVVASESARGVGKFVGDVYSTGANIFIRKPQAVLDIKTKTYRVATAEDVAKQRAYIRERVTKTTTGIIEPVFQTGKYLLPGVGQGLFFSEVGEEVSKYGGVSKYIKARPLEAGLIGGSLFLGGGLAVKSLVKSARVSKAVSKELESLEGVKLIGTGIKRDATGAYYLEAWRGTGDVKQVVRFYGKVEKGKGGFEFIPSGTGQRITAGKVTPEATTIKFKVLENAKGQPRLDISKGSKKLEPMFFSRLDEFRVSVGGRTFLKGRLSDVPIKRGDFTLNNTGKLAKSIRVYGDLSMTGVVPTRTRFGITSAMQSERKIEKEIFKQFKEKRKLDVSTLDIEFPKAERNILQLNKNKALAISPQEEMLLIRIPKKEVKSLGGVNLRGGKSSPEFLENMWKPQSQVLVPPKKVKMALKYVVKRKLEKPISVPSAAEASARLGTRTNFQTEISGLPIGSSKYVGTGQYERTDVVAPTFVPGITDRVLVREEVKVDSSFKPIVKPSPRVKTPEREKEFVKTILEPKVETTQKEIQKERIAMRELLGLKSQQAQKELQKQLQRQIQKVKLKSPTQLKIPKVPIPKTEGWLKNLAKKVDEGGFEAFGFSFGKAKRVTTGTKEEVAKGLSGFLKGELSASGFAIEKKTGKKLKAKELLNLVGEDFRVGKKDPFLLVEKQSKRLRKSGTGKTIQSFRPKGKIKVF